jgi:hypothetical protein
LFRHCIPYCRYEASDEAFCASPNDAISIRSEKATEGTWAMGWKQRLRYLVCTYIDNCFSRNLQYNIPLLGIKKFMDSRVTLDTKFKRGNYVWPSYLRPSLARGLISDHARTIATDHLRVTSFCPSHCYFCDIYYR